MPTESMLVKISLEENSKYHLSLMDGSKWLVNPFDTPTVAIWLPTSPIRIKDKNDASMFHYELTNLNSMITVSALRIK